MKTTQTPKSNSVEDRRRIRREFLDGDAAKKRAMLKAGIVVSQGWTYRTA